MPELNRLILLAGIQRRKGWRTLDRKQCDNYLPLDYLATIPPLPDIVNSVVWDEIELIHGIASFYPWDAQRLLREIHGVLKPGGLLVLEQPNLIECIRSGRVEWLYGDPMLLEPEHMAKWAYTPVSLHAACQLAGFSHSTLKAAQHHVPARDFRLEVIK